MPTIPITFEVEVTLEAGANTTVDRIIEQAAQILRTKLVDQEIVTFGDMGQLRRCAVVEVNEAQITVNDDGNSHPLHCLLVSADETAIRHRLRRSHE